MIKLTAHEMGDTMKMPEGTEYEYWFVRTSGWRSVISLPVWDWSDHTYRSVAPEGYEHTGEFRLPEEDDQYITWSENRLAKCVVTNNRTRQWILRKLPDPTTKPSDTPDEVEHEISKGSGNWTFLMDGNNNDIWLLMGMTDRQGRTFIGFRHTQVIDDILKPNFILWIDKIGEVSSHKEHDTDVPLRSTYAVFRKLED